MYHATKYMALPNILLHDPALEGLILDCQVIKIKNLQKKKFLNIYWPQKKIQIKNRAYKKYQVSWK